MIEKRRKAFAIFPDLVKLASILFVLASCHKPPSVAVSRQTVDTNIVIINIGQLKRDEIAKILLNIRSSNPKVIGMDMWFSGKKDDTLLAPAIETFENIVLAVHLGKCRKNFCDTVSKSYFPHVHQAHVRNVTDAKGFAKGFAPVICANDTCYPHFALKIVELYSPPLFYNYLHRNRNLDTEKFKFIGNQECFSVLEGAKIIEEENYYNPNLSDKIVLLGYVGKKIGEPENPFTELDYKCSPLGDGKTPDMYGVIFLANAIHMIINQK